MKDTLFIIAAPFADAPLDGTWFCVDCATMEGALLANPTWAEKIDVQRIAFPRPRSAVIELIGEANQNLPVLVLGGDNPIPPDALCAGERAFFTNPRAILRYLAQTYGGAGPHP